MDEPMLAQAAQDTIADVCGEGLDRNWLCHLVWERTGDELQARLAGIVNEVIAVALILVVAWGLTRLLRRFVTRFGVRMEHGIEERLDRAQARGAITETQRFKTRRLQRLMAITGVMRGAIAAVVWFCALLLVITRLGIPFQPLLAGAGLAGIVLGFGAQQLVRDVLAGIAMLIEDQYGVGDWIEVDGRIGAVERVGLRSSAFRDIDGTVHHVLNGSMQHVGNLSQSWAQATLDVRMALDTDVPTARRVIYEVAEELVADPVWGPDTIGPPEVWGVQDFGPEGLALRVVIPTRPLRNWQLVRQLRERLKVAFEEAGIRMPSQLVDVGGQQSGYAVLSQNLPAGAEPDGPHHRTSPTVDGAAGAERGAAPPRQRPAAEDVHALDRRWQRDPGARPD